MRAQVVLLDGDRILLARHERSGESYWVLPGGSVEPGEDVQEAAMREAHEETGLRIALERLLFIDGPRRAADVTIKQPRFTYLGRVLAGELHCVEDPAGGNPGNGHLCGAEWMPFESEEYDAATRDTLRLVQESLGWDAGPSPLGIE
ncbi:MAG TPA: NUDIX hydrolase [Chloroflexota bacterium]